MQTEPHPTVLRNGRTTNVQTTPIWGKWGTDILCGDCGAPLVYGRDGQYRHKEV